MLPRTVSFVRRHFILTGAALVVLAIILRALCLTADLPTMVPAEGAFYTDQGWYNHNVLKKLQTGSWFLEVDRFEITHTALFGFIQYGVYKLCGVHAWSSKLQPLTVSVAALLVAMWFFTTYSTPGIGLLFGGALAINYAHIVYSRGSLVEPTSALLILSAVVLWVVARDKGMLWAFLSGVATFLALINKTHGAQVGVFVVLAGFFEWFLFKENRRSLAGRTLLYFATVGAGYVLWKQWWINPHLVYWQSFGAGLVNLPGVGGGQMGAQMAIYIKAFNQYIYEFGVGQPVATALVIIGMYAAVREAVRGNRIFFRQNQVFIFCLLWFLAHAMFFVAAHYIRPRFQMLAIVPLLSVAVMVLFDNNLGIQVRTRMEKILFAGLALIVLTVWCYKTGSAATVDPLGMRILALVIIAVILALVWYRFAWLNSIKFRAGLMGVYIVMQAVPYAAWLGTATYTLAENGQRIKSVLVRNGDEQEYVLGPLASTFALEGNFKTISGLKNNLYSSFKLQYNEAIIRYKPRYVLHNARNIASCRKEYFPPSTQWDLAGTYTYAVRSSFTTPLPEDQTLYLYRLTYPE